MIMICKLIKIKKSYLCITSNLNYILIKSFKIKNTTALNVQGGHITLPYFYFKRP